MVFAQFVGHAGNHPAVGCLGDSVDDAPVIALRGEKRIASPQSLVSKA
jgi:hypothetical protein